MPELPEVETVVHDLRAVLVGRTIIAAEAGVPGVVRHPDRETFVRAVVGEEVVAVGRRGKFIHCRLGGGGDLVFHLGMTGHITVCAAGHAAPSHLHVRCGLDDGRELRFDDARRFGRVLLGPAAVLEELGILPRLGVEPLSPEFTVARLDGLLRTTTRTVKAALLDQAGIAGLGNIYVDEACHAAGVHPGRRAHRLTRAQRTALFTAIPAVLAAAIRDRGTTFDDYRDVWNARGRHRQQLRVYGRGGAPCHRCGALLRRTVIAGRTTVFCPGCQR